METESGLRDSCRLQAASVGSVLFLWEMRVSLYLYVTVIKISFEQLSEVVDNPLLPVTFKDRVLITCSEVHSIPSFRVWASSSWFSFLLYLKGC